MMKSYYSSYIAAFIGIMAMSFSAPAFGQVQSFTGLGQLPSGTGSRAYEVSADGTMIVGEAVNSSGETVAVIYDLNAGSPALIPLGFLPSAATNESKGRGVGVDSEGTTVYASGTAKNSSDKNQAFFWFGSRAGVGTMVAISFLSGGNESTGERLTVSPGTVGILSGEVVVTGKSLTTGTSYGMAFRYKAISDDLDPCGYMVDEQSGPRSSGYDVGWRFGSTYPIHLVGWGDSVWGGTPGGTRPQAFCYHYYDGNYACWPQRGLDWVCNHDRFQISAGDNHIADTNVTNPGDIKVEEQWTTGLFPPDAIVGSCGGDDHMIDQTSTAGDDINWPVNSMSDELVGWAQSFNYAISSNTRYTVGTATYPNHPYYSNDDYGNCENCVSSWPRQAFLRDIHNRDDYPPDNCYQDFHWPLGFLEGDNNSYAYGVSNGQGYDKTASRDGLVVVGFSQLQWPEIRCGSNLVVDTDATGDDEQVIGYGEACSKYDPVVRPGPNGFLDTPAASGDSYSWYNINDRRAFACFIEGGLDRYFLKHQGAGSDLGASAGSQFKDMKDLKAWLVSKGVDMTGWELREARGVSDDGTVIVGWGVHNSVEEGFVAIVDPSQPMGACCHTDGSCDDGVEEVDCPPLDVWQEDQLCAEILCCPKPWADSDVDGDVDLVDFGLWQLCFTGTGGGVISGCECYDRDDSTGAQGGDGLDVDEQDYGWFENCVTGPTVPLDINSPPAGCIP